MDLAKKFEFEQAVKEIQNNEEINIQGQKLIARDLKTFFESLKDEGFTDHQALRLTCERYQSIIRGV